MSITKTEKDGVDKVTYVRDKQGRLVREEKVHKDSRTVRALAAGFTFAGRCMPWGRYRAMVAPYWTSLGIAAASSLAWRNGVWSAPLLIAPAVGALFWWGPSLVARLVERRGGDVEPGSTKAGRWLDREPERVYAVAVTATAGVMSQAVTVFGWSKVTGWAWLLLTLAAAAPWQHHHRWWLRGPAKQQGALGEAWPRCQDKISKLKDCELGPNVGDGVVEKHLVTVPEGRDATSILDTGNLIARIIGMPAGSVTVTLGDDGEDLTAGQAWVIKSPKAKLKTAQIFQGPDLGREGTFSFANAPDGEIRVPAHDKDGVKHFAAFGAPGSGKGGAESLHVINRRETGWWLPIFVDGKGGTSIHGALQDACYHVARTPAEWAATIEGVYRAFVIRRAEFGKRRLTRYRIWEMWQEFPAYGLFLDELAALTRSLPTRSTQHLLEMAEQGRSLGFAIGLFGQSSRNDKIPGGAPMRALVTGGGAAWYGRAGDSPRDKTVEINNRTHSLTDFPAGAGWGLVTGGAMAGTRVIKARTLWVPDDPDGVDHLTGWVPSVPLPTPPKAELDALRFDEQDSSSEAPTVPGLAIESAAAETGPTARDAILRILKDAADAGEDELTMGEITRRTAEMTWRGGLPYDKSTIREALPKMKTDGVVQGLNGGWKRAS